MGFFFETWSSSKDFEDVSLSYTIFKMFHSWDYCGFGWLGITVLKCTEQYTKVYWVLCVFEFQGFGCKACRDGLVADSFHRYLFRAFFTKERMVLSFTLSLGLKLSLFPLWGGRRQRQSHFHGWSAMSLRWDIRLDSLNGVGFIVKMLAFGITAVGHKCPWRRPELLWGEGVEEWVSLKVQC